MPSLSSKATEEELKALAILLFPIGNRGKEINPDQKRKKFKRAKDKFRLVRDEEVGSSVTGEHEKKKKKAKKSKDNPAGKSETKNPY